MSPLVQRLSRLHALEVSIANRLQHLFLLVIRLYWGWQFFLTGRGKLMNIERTAQFFDSLGIPLPTLNAYAAGSVECVGGLLLLLGVASRVTAIPLIATMCVAYATAHAESLRTLFTSPDAFVYADPFLFLLASVVVLLFGPGAFSVDHVIGRRLSARRSRTSTDELMEHNNSRLAHA